MAQAVATPTQSRELAPGFKNPVHDVQACFRAIMNAMARPGSRQSVPVQNLMPPEPLTPVAAAIALTLFDYDTPVWLDRPLAASEAVTGFLRFHTSAPIVAEPVEAAFALISDPVHMIPLASFNQGSAEYPDTSTTVILTGQTLAGGSAVTLRGPGIKDTATLATGPLPPVFYEQVVANTKLFPRGVDLVLAGARDVMALPRSTQVQQPET